MSHCVVLFALIFSFLSYQLLFWELLTIKVLFPVLTSLKMNDNWKQNYFLIIVLLILCIGQMFCFFIVVLCSAASICGGDDDSQNDIEAATEFTETDPPSYDGVIEKEEKTCPSYDQAVKID